MDEKGPETLDQIVGNLSKNKTYRLITINVKMISDTHEQCTLFLFCVRSVFTICSSVFGQFFKHLAKRDFCK